MPTTRAGAPEQGRCGLGPRLPFLVISPHAKSDYVDSTVIDQSSVVKFSEYNWGPPALGNGAAERRGRLDPVNVQLPVRA